MSRKGREGFEEKEDEQVGLDVSEWIEFFYVGKKGAWYLFRGCNRAIVLGQSATNKIKRSDN